MAGAPTVAAHEGARRVEKRWKGLPFSPGTHMETVSKSFQTSDGDFSVSSIFRSLRLAKDEVLTRPYEQSGIVYSCGEVHRRSAKTLKLRLWRDAEMTTEVTEGALFELLKMPNQMMSSRTFLGMMAVNRVLGGGTALFLTVAGEPIEEGQMPDRMWPIRDDLVEPGWLKESDRGAKMPDFWRFTAASSNVSFPNHAVVRLYDPNPEDPLASIAPMAAAARRANVYFRMEAFDDALVERGGQIGHVITTSDGRILDEPAMKRLKESFDEQHKKVINDRGTAVMPPGTSVQQMAFSPREMDGKELRTWSRDEIMMVFGVTKPMLGITDDVNRANAREALRVFYENTAIPVFDDWIDTLQTMLIPRLPAPDGALFISYEIVGVAALREETDAQYKRADQLMKRGVSLAEAVAMTGLEVDPDLAQSKDEQFLDGNVRPIAQAAAAVPIPASFKDLDPSREARRRRADAAAKLLDKTERATAMKANRIMRRYVDAQIKRLKAIARGTIRGWGAGYVSESVSPWTLAGVADPWGEADCPSLEVKAVTFEELELLLLTGQESWADQLWDSVRPGIEASMDIGVAAAADTLNAPALNTGTDPALVRFLELKEIRIKEGSFSILAQRVREAIVTTMKAETEFGPLAERIAEAIDALEPALNKVKMGVGARAQLIARTEINSASNTARVAQMAASGITRGTWLSSGDELVRTSHNIDGEEVNLLRGVFSNGLRYPSDPAGPIGEIANCRCTIEPAIGEQE